LVRQTARAKERAHLAKPKKSAVAATAAAPPPPPPSRYISDGVKPTDAAALRAAGVAPAGLVSRISAAFAQTILVDGLCRTPGAFDRYSRRWYEAIF